MGHPGMGAGEVGRYGRAVTGIRVAIVMDVPDGDRELGWRCIGESGR